MKKMILVSSPPACGKTYISKQLAKNLKNAVYLDKDTLIPLSKQIFRVAKKPYDRSSDFFEENVRDYEYEVILSLAFEALRYAECVIVNAPFTRELNDVDYVLKLKSKLGELGAKLFVIWIMASAEVCRNRMKKRNSDRDGYKISHWDEYVQTIDFAPPASLNDPSVKDGVIMFYNSSEPEFIKSMHDAMLALGESGNI